MSSRVNKPKTANAANNSTSQPKTANGAKKSDTSPTKSEESDTILLTFYLAMNEIGDVWEVMGSSEYGEYDTKAAIETSIGCDAISHWQTIELRIPKPKKTVLKAVVVPE